MSWWAKWVAVMIVLIVICAGLFKLGMMSDRGDLMGFDGWIAEPGCDWGNPRCEREDYRYMCAAPSNDERLQWEIHCKGKDW